MRMLFVAVAAAFLPGCAVVTTGYTQPIAVDTGGHSAQCALQNNQGTWQVDSTPGTANVHRDFGDLTVNCSSPDGTRGVASVASSTESAVWGNFLIGGILGGALDMTSGAAYRYPSVVSVSLSQPIAPLRQLESPLASDMVRCRYRGSVEMRERGRCLSEGGQTIERVQ